VIVAVAAILVLIAVGTETFCSDTKEDIGFEIELMTADRDMTILGGELRLRLTSETAGVPDQPVTMIVYDRYEPGMMAYDNISHSVVDSNLVDPEHPERNTVWFGSTVVDRLLSEFTLKDTTTRMISLGYVGMGYYGETIDLDSMRMQDREPGTYYDYVIDMNPTVYTLKEGHSIVIYITAYDPETVKSIEEKLLHYDVTVDPSSVELVLDLV